MKITKNLFFSILLVIILLITINYNSEAVTCPDASYSTKVVHIPFNGCMYTIEVCYKCDPTAPGPVVIFDETIQAQSGSCPPPYDWDLAIPYIRDYVSSAQFVFNELCSWFNPPPCNSDPNTWQQVTFKYRFCFTEYGGPDKVRPCDDNYEDYCEVTFKYCKPDPNGTAVTRYLVPGSNVVVGEIPDCPLFGEHGSGCFRVNTLCNP